eukprot:TRINITY_DN2860_c0_g1_i1.p1 TRINITY_DN2860_c0_g1~~TRINITY_DN2860_c0_g1_i1.p1  ORF type:complete len:188 (+),score=57.11 TRINITY_DN2860_c0_g1_i1:86-649(+)
MTLNEGEHTAPEMAEEDDGEGADSMAEMMKAMGGDGGMGGMADMMSAMGGDGGKGGMPDMSALMSMLGGKGGMGGSAMGGKGVGGKGMGKEQPDDSEKVCDGYVWQQKGEEIQIRFDKPGLSKKDVKVLFKRFSLKVELASEVVLEGKLFGAVEVDDCCWSIDPDTKQCMVMLTKQSEKEEWGTLME